MHFPFAFNELILYVIGPWVAYLIGKTYVFISNRKHSFIILTIILSLGMFLHGLLNIYAYINSEHYATYEYYRISVDFWRNETVNVKSTEMLFVMATGVGLGVLFSSTKLCYKIYALATIVISLAVTAFLANRTLIVVFVIIFAWRWVYWFLNRSVSLIKKLLALIGIPIIVFSFIAMIESNLFGLKDFFNSLKIIKRFTSDSEGARSNVWSVFFENSNFMKYPWGGKFITEGTEYSYLHNTWLDVYNVAGVIPFLLFLILTVVCLIQFLKHKTILNRYNKAAEATIMQSLMIAVALNMMVEPILESNPYYFIAFLMILGACKGYTKRIVSEAKCFSSTK